MVLLVYLSPLNRPFVFALRTTAGLPQDELAGCLSYRECFGDAAAACCYPPARWFRDRSQLMVELDELDVSAAAVVDQCALGVGHHLPQTPGHLWCLTA